MTITAAELLSQANERTGKSETDISYFIKAWAHELTIMGIDIEGSQDVSLIDNQPNYDISAYLFKKIIAAHVLDSGGYAKDPLTEISFYQYKLKLAENHSKTEPKEYALFNNILYLTPPPNATTYPTLRLSGITMHADSTTISFPDRFRECGIEYICFKIWEKYGQANTFGAPHLSEFIRIAYGLKAFQSTMRKTVTRYNDI